MGRIHEVRRSGGMIYMPSIVKIGSGVQVILRLLPQNVERLQFWYCGLEGFVNYALEMASFGIR
jgi:hypothetical protein